MALPSGKNNDPFFHSRAHAHTHFTTSHHYILRQRQTDRWRAGTHTRYSVLFHLLHGSWFTWWLESRAGSTILWFCSEVHAGQGDTTDHAGTASWLPADPCTTEPTVAGPRGHLRPNGLGIKVNDNDDAMHQFYTLLLLYCTWRVLYFRAGYYTPHQSGRVRLASVFCCCK